MCARDGAQARAGWWTMDYRTILPDSCTRINGRNCRLSRQSIQSRSASITGPTNASRTGRQPAEPGVTGRPAPADTIDGWPSRTDVLELFHPAVAEWFRASFDAPTPPQRQGWPAIARGESTLILAPTGSGKTLTAFLWCINRLMFDRGAAAPGARCRVLYISPLKALAVDIERNLRAPLAGIANRAAARGDCPPSCRRSRSAPATRRRSSGRASSASRPTS